MPPRPAILALLSLLILLSSNPTLRAQDRLSNANTPQVGAPPEIHWIYRTDQWPSIDQLMQPPSDQSWIIPRNERQQIHYQQLSDADIQTLLEAQQAAAAQADPQSTSPEANDQAEASSADSSVLTFLAVGQQSHGIIFYSFNGERTTGMFSASTVERLDEKRLLIDQLEAQIEGSSPDAPMSWFRVLNAHWFPEINLLNSQENSEFRRPNLRIVGQGCRYTQDSEVIEMYGNCQTHFYPNQNPAASANQPDPLLAE